MNILDHRDFPSSRCGRKHKKKPNKCWLRSGNKNPWPIFLLEGTFLLSPHKGSKHQYKRGFERNRQFAKAQYLQGFSRLEGIF